MNEWMPENPYRGLPKEIGDVAIAIETGKCYGFDEGVKAAQKKLLEYLKSWNNGSSNRLDGKLEQMLKQLEAQDGK